MKHLPLVLGGTLTAFAFAQETTRTVETDAEVSRLVKFDELNSTAVKNRVMDDGEAEDEKVADMADLVLGPDGAPLFVTLSRGGLGDLGDTLILVPKNEVMVKWEAAEDGEVPGFEVHTTLSDDELGDAPELDEDAWCEDGETSRRATESYFGLSRKDVAPVEASARTAGNAMFRITEMMGEDIDGADGEEVAEVVNVILDPRTWEVAFVVIELEDDLEMGDELRALPISAFRMGRDADDDHELECALRISLAELAEAPIADPDRWEEQGTTKFAEEVAAAFQADETDEG